MHGPCNRSAHSQHAFESFDANRPEGLLIRSRRNLLKLSLAGLAGLAVPDLLRARDQKQAARGKSVILLWMTGGPSQLDTWDMKPDRPLVNRGPFSPIRTAIPGEWICEHLPKQAAMLDQFTIIRSVDCRKSNHEPNMVMQSGHRDAEPRTNPRGDRFPSFGSVVARYRGANHPAVPPYIAFEKHRSHIGYAGYLGHRYDPFIAGPAAKLPIYDDVGRDTGRVTSGELFQFSPSLSFERMMQRKTLLHDFDSLRRMVDASSAVDVMDRYQQQAVDTILGGRIQPAFDLSLEPVAVREEYGKHLWCQQALLARRLVQAGVAFVTIDLSYHAASGTWDTHGDNIPPYGGITKGLGPLLPLFDHLLTTLIRDLDRHDLLDDVLVISMGEFGRTPMMGTQGSTDGRDHWPEVMSICLAGGGLRHGQVIGSTDREGATIKNRPVTPGDLAATIYRHMDVPLDTMYEDEHGRPLAIVQENGQPIAELF